MPSAEWWALERERAIASGRYFFAERILLHHPEIETMPTARRTGPRTTSRGGVFEAPPVPMVQTAPVVNYNVPRAFAATDQPHRTWNADYQSLINDGYWGYVVNAVMMHDIDFLDDCYALAYIALDTNADNRVEFESLTAEQIGNLSEVLICLQAQYPVRYARIPNGCPLPPTNIDLSNVMTIGRLNDAYNQIKAIVAETTKQGQLARSFQVHRVRLEPEQMANSFEKMMNQATVVEKVIRDIQKTLRKATVEALKVGAVDDI